MNFLVEVDMQHSHSMNFPNTLCLKTSLVLESYFKDSLLLSNTLGWMKRKTLFKGWRNLNLDFCIEWYGYLYTSMTLKYAIYFKMGDSILYQNNILRYRIFRNYFWAHFKPKQHKSLGPTITLHWIQGFLGPTTKK